MDNIKNFEDFLDRMQGLLDSAKKQGHILVRVEDLENTFPELRESEDKKIRGAIIDHLKDYGLTEWAAWLEKQGESTDINPSEFDLRLNKLLKQFETLSKEELASSLSFYLNVVQNDGTYKADEKQGEQKPTDKVEPKFKVGDWVVDNANYIWKIEGILNQFYILKDIEGGESRPTIEWTDNTFHLWTIQDAKDGDVLQLGVVTAIFQKYIGNGNCKCYCSVCDGIFEIPSQDDDDYYGCHDATPATKEQRELLFKSMKDDGYEWDAEKKELKKIELTKSESEEELSDFEAALFSAFSDGWQQYLHGEEVDFAQWAKEHSAELLEAANQNHVAWSEEDERMYKSIIYSFDHNYPLLIQQQEFVKSLKPQNNITDEELAQAKKDAYNDAIDKIEYHSGEPTFDDGWSAAIDYIRKKSLKPQSHWKPTEAQLASLTIACDRNDRIGFDLTQLLKELKKL